MKTYSSLTTREPSTQTSGELARIDGETAYIQRREQGASSRLQPATWDQAQPVIAQLFTLPMANRSDDDGVLGAMQLAVDGEPLWAIKETVAAFLTGRAGKGFCPSSAELGVELRLRTDPERERLRRAHQMARDARALQQENSGPLSEETRALAAAAIARMRANAERDRIPPRAEVDPFADYRSPVGGGYRSRPLTPEDVDGVPDAPKRSMPRIPVPSFMPFSRKDQA